MKFSHTARPWLLAALLIWHAPGHTATIAGVVAEGGRPVGEAEITLANADTGTVLKSVYSDKDGTFRFSVGPGTFHVGAFKPDYSRVWNRGIVVRDDDVALHIELVNKAFAEGGAASTGGDCE